MILNSHFYPDWEWKKLQHYNEEKERYEGDAVSAIIEGNRLGGKSVGVGIYALHDFFKYGYKCVFVTRYKDDMEDSKIQPLESFWKKSWRFINSDVVRVPDIDDHVLSFKGHHAYIDDHLFCYPASLSVSGKGKLADYDGVRKIIFDEYVSEDNSELPDEVTAIYRLYDTVTRGRDDALKTTSMIFISNCISKVCSLKEELGISREIRSDTKRIDRADKKGWIYERVMNDAVAEEYNKSAIAKLMKCGEIGRSYLGYAQNNEFKDNAEFVQTDTPKGKNIYLCNITYNGKTYCMKHYPREGIIYFSDIDVIDDFPINYAMTKEDHTMNTMLISNKAIRDKLIQYKLNFAAGMIRFSSLTCKNVFLDIHKYL